MTDGYKRNPLEEFTTTWVKIFLSLTCLEGLSTSKPAVFPPGNWKYWLKSTAEGWIRAHFSKNVKIKLFPILR